ncbi:hypothetical protein HanIR_Chr11g0511021 [Helianthus annuus]|nr:hypothetical protein HanIR_Chr11g0511021 [Helianthus annuus]
MCIFELLVACYTKQEEKFEQEKTGDDVTEGQSDQDEKDEKKQIQKGKEDARDRDVDIIDYFGCSYDGDGSGCGGGCGGD